MGDKITVNKMQGYVLQQEVTNQELTSVILYFKKSLSAIDLKVNFSTE